jgi:hypothetical protein
MLSSQNPYGFVRMDEYDRYNYTDTFVIVRPCGVYDCRLCYQFQLLAESTIGTLGLPLDAPEVLAIREKKRMKLAKLMSIRKDIKQAKRMSNKVLALVSALLLERTDVIMDLTSHNDSDEQDPRKRLATLKMLDEELTEVDRLMKKDLSLLRYTDERKKLLKLGEKVLDREIKHMLDELNHN